MWCWFDSFRAATSVTGSPQMVGMRGCRRQTAARGGGRRLLREASPPPPGAVAPHMAGWIPVNYKLPVGSI
jgi:hypothetical protein